MTNLENIQEIVNELESDKHDQLAQLKYFPSGVALIELLQELSDIALRGLASCPADQIHRVAEVQGRYRLINMLLERIMNGDEDAKDGND